MTKKIFLTAVLIFSLISVSQAQDVSQKLAIGVEIGTNGPGVTLATSLSSNLKLRAGVNFLSGKLNTDYTIEPDGYISTNPETTIPLTGALSNPKLDFTKGRLVVDYYPSGKNGIFSISAGLYAGNNSISIDGIISNYKDPNTVFDFEDITVKPNADGTFDGKLKLGNTIKPYFGIGLGRTIANSRVGFKFDLGLMYQGDYKFESKNVFVDKNYISKQANRLSAETDIPAWLLKCWPVVNFSLSYRLF